MKLQIIVSYTPTCWLRSSNHPLATSTATDLQ